MLDVNETAPDFSFGETTLYRVLVSSRVALFFFPKAFTPG